MSDPSPAHRNQYALAALREARALAAGELAQIESQFRLKQEALAHIDFVLRLFAPEIDPEAIPSRRPRKDNPYPVPHLNRMLLTILRRRGEPMPCPEVVDAVMAEAKLPDEASAVIAGRVRQALRHMAERDGGMVVKTGQRAEAVWGLR